MFWTMSLSPCSKFVLILFCSLLNYSCSGTDSSSGSPLTACHVHGGTVDSLLAGVPSACSGTWVILSPIFCHAKLRICHPYSWREERERFSCWYALASCHVALALLSHCLSSINLIATLVPFVSFLLVIFQFEIRRELVNTTWCLGFMSSSVFHSWCSMLVTLLLQWSFPVSVNCKCKSKVFLRHISGNLLICCSRRLSIKNELKVSLDAVLRGF